MSWSEIELGQALKIKHGFAFKSKYFSEDGKYIVLTPGNFHEEGGFRGRPGKDRYFVGDIPDAFVLEEGDLIVAMTEQGAGLLGSAALIPKGKYLHNQRLGLVQDLNESLLIKQYLYYLFNIREVRLQISASATGVKVKHTAPGRIYRVKVRIPDTFSQNKIASILSAYDDLIENNNRRIALLEESARLLYREWFVRLRFPGHENTRITDGVPEGWASGKVGDLGSIITGKTPSTKIAEYYGGDIPFVKTPDMHGKVFVLETESYLTDDGAKTQPKKFIPDDSIMVSCIGTVGVVAITQAVCHTNQQINSVIPNEKKNLYYCYFVLKGLKEAMLAIGGGVTMSNVNKSKFTNLDILLPEPNVTREFYEFCQPVFTQIKTLQTQNQKLKTARDLLLPKLMNGEIPV